MFCAKVNIDLLLNKDQYQAVKPGHNNNWSTTKSSSITSSTLQMLVNKNSGVDCKCDLFRSMNTWPCTVCDTDILMPGVDTFICALTLPHLYSTDNLPHLCDLSSSLSHLPTLIHSFCTQHNLSFIPCQLIVYILYSTCQCLVKHAPTSLVKCLFELYIWKWEVLLLFPWQILANGLVVKDPTRHDTLFYPDVQHKMI